MQQLVYVRPGGRLDDPADTVVISSVKSPYMCYIIGSPTGLGAVSVKKATTTAPGIDGTYLQDVTLEARTISDTITVMGSTRVEMYENRLRLQRLLNPRRGIGTLYYTNNFGHWMIRAVPDTYGTAEKRITDNKCQVKVSFYCPDPYWTDVVTRKIYLSQKAQQGICLPATLPARFPQDRINAYLTNPSDEEALTTVVVHGPAKGVRICNEKTGEEIAFDRVIEANQRLTLDSQMCTARLATDSDSSEEVIVPRYGYRFITIQPGLNHIVVQWNKALPGASVTIEWRCRYVGV